MKISIGVVIIIGMLATAISSADESFTNYVQRIKDGVGRVETTNGKFLGSAFYINTEGMLLTCAHVVQQNSIYLDSVVVVNYATVVDPADSSTTEELLKLQCSVLHVLPQWDLAVLQVEKGKYPYSRYPWHPLGMSSGLKEGEDIALCAFIDDKFKIPKAFIAKGIVSTIRRNVYDDSKKNKCDFIQMDLSVSKGTSGGAVFSASTGEIVAIMNAGIFESNKSKHTAYAIAFLIDQLTPAFDSLGIPYEIR